ncbi:MAG: hypothetical protein VX069_06060 [Cyanobacteriota bacterium]|nr:hypothetical protein [Cyanobacteriota bacterium]MED5384670.1 hypothetical protein [Cyanobacteriota bacterium]
MVVLRYLVLPLRAPLLLLLFGVAVLMGNHWTLLQLHLENTRNISAQLFWTVEVTQVLAVVVICTMPDLLMRQVSMLMAASRVISLVITLLLVITLGIYVLRLNLLSDILIMATSILLARLDLSRIGVSPPPAITGCLLFILVISGLLVGHALPSPVLFADA